MERNSRESALDSTTLAIDRPARQGAAELMLRVLGDGFALQRPLPAEGELVLGRGAESDLRIEDPSISRRHALLEVRRGSIRIKDLGSANGTRVGERTLEAGEAVSIEPGDLVDLGSVMLIVQRGYRKPPGRELWPHSYFEARVEEECGRAAGKEFAVACVMTAGSNDGLLEELGRVFPGAVTAAHNPSQLELLLADSALSAEEIQGRLGAAGERVQIGTAAFPRDGRSAGALLAVARERARGGSGSGPGRAGLIVLAPEMLRLYRLVDRVAVGEISVLVLGETGVGKEVVAEELHRRSRRGDKPFLRLNCGGFSEHLLESELFGHEKGAFTGAERTKPGLLETADGGTVFLDEIGELAPSLQVKLLRVIEERQVLRVGALKPRSIDVRFVAATNRDLEAEVAAGRFREDLYYRLSGMTLVVPPLRERGAEIGALSACFAAAAAERGGGKVPELDAAVLALLAAYRWPGNIRELRNTIERAVLLAGGERIGLEHLPLERLTAPAARAARTAAGTETGTETGGGPLDSLRGDIEELEKRRILDALDKAAGNQSHAARMLGIARGTLAARMDAFGIRRPRKKR